MPALQPPRIPLHPVQENSSGNHSATYSPRASGFPEPTLTLYNTAPGPPARGIGAKCKGRLSAELHSAAHLGLLLQGRLSLRFSGSPSRCSAPSLVASSSLPAVTSAKTDASLTVTSSPDLSLNAHTHTRKQASPFHCRPSRTRWSRVSSGPPRGSPARSSLAPPALHLDQLEKLLVTQPGKNPGAALDTAFPLAHLPANPFGSKLKIHPLPPI